MVSALKIALFHTMRHLRQQTAMKPSTPGYRVVEVAIRALTENNMDSEETKPPMLTFERYCAEHVMSYERYKKEVQEAFPESTEESVKKSYASHCQAMYRTYEEWRKNSHNRRGIAI